MSTKTEDEFDAHTEVSMILVHRIKGEPLYLNADLIEFVESTPDTVITLADGRKMMVAETPAEIVDLAKLFRASVIVASDELRDRAARLPGTLTLLPVVKDSDAVAVAVEQSQD